MAATKLIACASLILLAAISAPTAFAANDGSGGVTAPSTRPAPTTVDPEMKARRAAKRAERRAARKAARKARRDAERRAQQPSQF
jgi:hypothetical protein